MAVSRITKETVVTLEGFPSLCQAGKVINYPRP